MELKQITPRTPQWALYILAGVVWSAVGLMLLRWPWTWLSELGMTGALLPVLAGLPLLVISSAGFHWMARKNASRIGDLPDRVCLFAFQRWSSYPLVVFMIALGLALRHSPIQRTWLAPVYIAIGGGLVLASLVYYRGFLMASRVESPPR